MFCNIRNLFSFYNKYFKDTYNQCTLIMLIFILIMALFHNSVSQQLFGTQTFSTSLALQNDLLQKLGVQIVRLLVSWRQLEETGKSQYQSWYLDSMDEYIQSMTQMNIKIILQMTQILFWALTSSNNNFFKCHNSSRSNHVKILALASWATENKCQKNQGRYIFDRLEILYRTVCEILYYRINQRRNEYNPISTLFMYYNPKNFKSKNKKSFQAQNLSQIKFFHQIWYWISFQNV
jgi:hypothetical protein